MGRSGKKATGAGSLFAQPLRARRLIVRDVPAHAIELAMAVLAGQGFERSTLNLNSPLAANHSAWQAEMLEIGDNLRSGVRGCGYSCLTLIFPLIEFLPVRLRGIAHTEVVVASRTQADGTCELVISPNMPFSLISDPDEGHGSSMAGARVNAAVAQLAHSYQAADRKSVV